MVNENKEVLSYMIYMWNSWDFNECMEVFDGDTDNPYDLVHHLWNKYMEIVDSYGVNSAPALFVSILDEDNLDKIVQRACTLYYGRKNK